MTRMNMLTTSLAALAITMTPALAQPPTTVDPIVGTWVMKVPGGTPDETFFAIHTFHQGGTFSENSTLLPSLVEGPAQGTWRREGNSYKLSFILFAFEEGVQVGYLRVRCVIKLAGDKLDATTEVDFIDPEGHAEVVGNGPFFGTRQKVDDAGSMVDVPLGVSQSGENSARAGDKSARLGRDTKSRGWSRFAMDRRR